MAKQTRAERRARRQQEAAGPARGGGDGRGAKPPERVAPQPPSRPERERGRRTREEGGGFGRFFIESWGELKKVEWPSQNHVIQGTVVVLIACVIVGTFIWVADIAFKHFVQDVLLR